MKYKVGDKVRVRGDLESRKDYGGVPFLKRMECLKNKIAEITKSEDGYYGLSIDNISYAWTDEMLRPAEFKIWCKTEEEKQAVLEELEKEGYVWCSGRKPTNPYISVEAPMFLSVNRIGICQGKDRVEYSAVRKAELTPSEFTGIDFFEEIIITKTSTGATATYGDKTVTAKGEFEDASRQALAEVLCPFKVGDRVQRKERTMTDNVYVVEDIISQCKIKAYDSIDDEYYFLLDKDLEPHNELLNESLYNAKLFCIKSCGGFEAGHIYEIKDGVFTDGNPNHTMTVSNINELNDRFGEHDECYFMEGYFMEVTEE